jgi:cytochrome c553
MNLSIGDRYLNIINTYTSSINYENILAIGEKCDEVGGDENKPNITRLLAQSKQYLFPSLLTY